MLRQISQLGSCACVPKDIWVYGNKQICPSDFRFQIPILVFESEDRKPSAAHDVGSALLILVEFNSTRFGRGAKTTLLD